MEASIIKEKSWSSFVMRSKWSMLGNISTDFANILETRLITTNYPFEKVKGLVSFLSVSVMLVFYF